MLWGSTFFNKFWWCWFWFEILQLVDSFWIPTHLKIFLQCVYNTNFCANVLIKKMLPSCSFEPLPRFELPAPLALFFFIHILKRQYDKKTQKVYHIVFYHILTFSKSFSYRTLSNFKKKIKKFVKFGLSYIKYDKLFQSLF